MSLFDFLCIRRAALFILLIGKLLSRENAKARDPCQNNKNH